MTFEDLLNRLEDLVCDVVDRVLKSPAAELLYDINPVSQISWEIYVCVCVLRLKYLHSLNPN